MVMAKKKYYAVRTGKKTGIYTNWKDAEAQVIGFPGAEYKSFNTEDEAVNYIDSKRNTDTENLDEYSNEDINKKIREKIKTINEDTVMAFTDGSYSSNINGKAKYSFGAVLITSDGEYSIYESFASNEYSGSRNVAGEIEGVKQSILWSIQNNKKRIDIYYDYAGVEKWALKEWKTNIDLTKEYVKFFDEKSKLIEINFFHIKAHNGILYNEKADELAKKALLIDF